MTTLEILRPRDSGSTTTLAAAVFGHLLEKGLLDDKEPADTVGQGGQVREERVRVEVVDISAKGCMVHHAPTKPVRC